MNLQLTPEQRAMLAGVSIPDLPIGGLPPAKLLQQNSPDLLDSPDNPDFLKGAIAGGFVVPSRDGPAFMPNPPGFHFVGFGFDRVFNEFEAGPDGRPRFIAAHNDKPEDAIWRDGPSGRTCLNDQGHQINETIGLYMIVEETGQIARFNFARTSLPVARDFANRAQRLTVHDYDDLKGIVLGRYAMTARLEKKGERRWFLPVVTRCGKLGEEDGPSLATTLHAAELRQAFREGLSLPESIEPPAPPPIANDVAERAWSLEGPPPIDRYDGPNDELDRVEF